jgi:hypothetical protein
VSITLPDLHFTAAVFSSVAAQVGVLSVDSISLVSLSRLGTADWKRLNYSFLR